MHKVTTSRSAEHVEGQRGHAAGLLPIPSRNLRRCVSADTYFSGQMGNYLQQGKKSGFGDHVRRGLDPAKMEIARSWQLVDPRLGVVSPAVSK